MNLYLIENSRFKRIEYNNMRNNKLNNKGFIIIYK